MERIRYFAGLSVKRACAFSLLAILTVVIGLSSQWLLACRAAAILLTLQTGILLILAWRAPYTHYSEREIWLLLDRFHGLPEHRAQPAISAIMRQTFLDYAEISAWPAAALWLVLLGRVMAG